ncbi:MAG TPA: Stp1/IreP family PP2C-type Ser/Thr phosphatase [Acidobacteriota bacterium]|nr:Stp1/IreP family PP2C-type Ser/Thr phosphatase [Acidobacteriota bacterium]
MKVTFKAVSDVGRKRTANEDSLFADEELNLFVVADGMGGHAAGEVASKIAVDSIQDFIRHTNNDKEITWPYEFDESLSMAGNRLKTAIQSAHAKVLEATSQKKEFQGMATTVVSMLVADGKAQVAHVGDSRAYLIRGDRLIQLTSDHSWVNEQLRTGAITSAQARNHPYRNIVTRALGGPNPVDVDVAEEAMQDGDIVLLCSDGLNTMISDEQILEIIVRNKEDLDQACKELVDTANANGGEDNITAILVKHNT